MRAIDHEGTFFKVCGPLDVPPPPQDRMPIITAGYSEEANEFTAEVADMVYAAAPNIEVARTFYADLKGRLPRHGRHPLIRGFSRRSSHLNFTVKLRNVMTSNQQYQHFGRSTCLCLVLSASSSLGKSIRGEMLFTRLLFRKVNSIKGGISIPPRLITGA